MFRLPALALDSVKVAVMLALSTSLTTMSVRFSAVSSVYVSAAFKLVAIGASLIGFTLITTLATFESAPPSLAR